MRNSAELGISIPDMQPVWPTTKSEPIIQAQGVSSGSERSQLDDATLSAMQEVSDAMLNGMATDSNGNRIDSVVMDYVHGAGELPIGNVVVDLSKIEPQA